MSIIVYIILLIIVAKLIKGTAKLAFKLLKWGLIIWLLYKICSVLMGL